MTGESVTSDRTRDRRSLWLFAVVGVVSGGLFVWGVTEGTPDAPAAGGAAVLGIGVGLAELATRERWRDVPRTTPGVLLYIGTIFVFISVVSWLDPQLSVLASFLLGMCATAAGGTYRRLHSRGQSEIS